MNNFELDDKAEDMITCYTPYYLAKQLLLCQEELKEIQESLAKQVERNNRLYTDMMCLVQQRNQTYD